MDILKINHVGRLMHGHENFPQTHAHTIKKHPRFEVLWLDPPQHTTGVSYQKTIAPPLSEAPSSESNV